MTSSEDDRHGATLDRYDRQAGAYREAAIKFSLLAVTNLILINAGGLLALANGLFGGGQSQPASVGQSGIWFVAGLVAAVVCAYVGYLNFGMLANQQMARRAAEDWSHAKNRMTAAASERQIPFDQPGFLVDGRSMRQFAAESDQIIDQQTKEAASLNRWISGTFGAGQVFGIVSVICFVLGCYVLIASSAS